MDNELKRLDWLENEAVRDFDCACDARNEFLIRAAQKTWISILLQKQEIYKRELERIKNL